jgi:hypothetical protein
MIAIFLNSREWGGVDILIERLAVYLNKQNINFVIVDHKNSRLRGQLPPGHFIEHYEIAILAKKVTHVLVPSITKLRYKSFPWQELSHAKLLTWIVHPNDPFRAYFPFSGYLLDCIGYRGVNPLKSIFHSHTKILSNFFCNLASGKSLVVMDGATQRSLKYFYPDLRHDVDCVPIPSPVSFERESKLESNDAVSIGYLGRIDHFKWSALQYVVEHDLAAMASSRPVELHAVAGGTHLHKLKELCILKRIAFHSYGYLPIEEAKKILTEKTNVAIAMGTSALDIAGTGLPCIVIDPALGFCSSPQTLFRYVHETIDHTLGEYRDIPHYVAGKSPLVDLVNAENLEKASKVSRIYVSLNHDPDRCFEKLTRCIYGSSISIRDTHHGMKFLETSFLRVKSKPIKSVLENFVD